MYNTVLAMHKHTDRAAEFTSESKKEENSQMKTSI
jgi:hypothetical protein